MSHPEVYQLMRALLVLAVGIGIGGHSEVSGAASLKGLTPLAASTDSTPKIEATEIKATEIKATEIKATEIKAPMIMQYWASWCGSCSSVFWDLDELVKTDLKIVSISIDDKKSAALNYLKKHPIYRKYADRFYWDGAGSAKKAFQVSTIPTILVVDSNGDVAYRHEGHTNGSDLLAIKKAIHGVSREIAKGRHRDIANRP